MNAGAASQNETKIAYIKLNIQTPSAFAEATARQVPTSWRCLPRHSSVCDGGSQLTKDVVRGSFTLDTWIAFGDGCDCSGCVAKRMSVGKCKGKTEFAVKRAGQG